jgi:LacI family transcriptional regulator, repressor for deo operon, udp, cdd, tsx, nupC, and nupG
MLQRKEADGLILLGHRLPKSDGDLVRSMAPACAPVVNGCEFNPQLRIPSVHIDNAAAASEAIDHLYNLDHRRIGIVTGPLVSPLSRDRLHGATTRARVEGTEQDFVIMHGDFSIESGAFAAERLFARCS